jgi:PhzF family phenazine biosynthesis protein
MKVYTLNSFAKTIDGGNPAGVCLEGDHLTDIRMQEIARRVGFSETAFLNSSDKADFNIRYFTPNGEVDLCGHATIAAFHLLKMLQLIKRQSFIIETAAGLINVEVMDEGVVFMDLKPPLFFEKVDRGEIAQTLNIDANDFVFDLPCQIVSTGLKDIIVPVKNLKVLLNIKPNFEEIIEISKKYKAGGIHSFSIESLMGANGHARNFAPLYDIPEEAATGTASGALACYLYKYGLLNKKQLDKITLEQGYIMNRPSELMCRLVEENNEIEKVQVGGNAYFTGEKVFQL